MEGKGFVAKDHLLSPFALPLRNRGEEGKIRTSRWTVDIEQRFGREGEGKKKAPDDNCSLFNLCTFTPSGPGRSALDNA